MMSSLKIALVLIDSYHPGDEPVNVSESVAPVSGFATSANLLYLRGTPVK